MTVSQPGRDAADARAAGESAVKDKRWPAARGHFLALLAQLDVEHGTEEVKQQAAHAYYRLAQAAVNLKEEGAKDLLLKSYRLDSSSVAVARLLAKLYHKEGQLQPARDWTDRALKRAAAGSPEARELAGRLEQLETEIGLQHRLKTRYSEPRLVRIEVGRLIAQDQAATPSPTASYYILPQTWWDAWCIAVGGFSLDKDVAAWTRIKKQTGRLDHALGPGPVDAVVARELGVAGIVLPKLDGPAEPAAAPIVGPIVTGPLLAGLPHDTLPSTGEEGPRLLDGLRVDADVQFVGEELWGALKKLYGVTGPEIVRFMVPRIASSHGPSNLILDLYPEKRRFPMEEEEEGEEEVVIEDFVAAMAAITVGDSLELEAGAVTPGRETAPSTRCAVCDAPTDNRCPACKVTYYCCSKCQAAAWNRHKKHCKELAASGPSRAAGGGSIVERNGKTGLSNLGNTCFMNSSLQALSSVWPLTEFFISGRWEAEVNSTNPLGSRGNALVRSYAALMRDLWLSDAAAVSPREFKSSIARFQSRFSGFQQHDAQELLNFLLDCLHEDLNAVRSPPYVEDEESKGRPDALVAALSWEKYQRRNRSRMLDVVAGQYKSTVVCPSCKLVSVKFDPYWTVVLPIPPPSALQAGKQTIEILFSRMTWDPSNPAFYSVPSAKASEEVRAAWDGPSLTDGADDGADDGELISSHFDQTGRIVRYVVEVETRGGVVAPRDVLEALALQTNVPASSMVLQRLDESAAAHGVVQSERPSESFENALPQPSFLSRLGKAPAGAKNKASWLHAVEVTPQGWLPPAAIARTPKNRREPAHSVRSLLHVNVLVEHPRAAQASVAKGSKACMAALIRTAPDELVGTYSSIVPLIIPVAAGMSVAALRMVLARELYSVTHESALFAMSGVPWDGIRGVRPPPEGTSLSEVQMFIASHLLLNPEQGQFADGYLPTILPTGEDAPVPDAVHGLELSALTTRLDQVLDFTRSPDLAEASLNVHIRGPLVVTGAAAHAGTIFHRSELPPLRSMLDAESWKAAAAAPLQRARVPLHSCLEAMTWEETLEKDNMWFCSTCKEHRQAKKKLEIWSLPDFVVLLLKRFEIRGYSTRKVDTLVDFPLRGLDMSSLHASQAAANTDPALLAEVPEGVVLPTPVASDAENSLYDCVSVINHMGSAFGGHYTAFANHDVGMHGAATSAGQWHLFDDSHVSKADASDVVSRAAYVLVYRRRRQLKRAL